MYTYKLLIYNFNGTIYLHRIFLKILSYCYINLCQILNQSKLGPAKFINLQILLIYRVLIYRGSSVLLFFR